MENILITGANGKIASAIISRLYNKNVNLYLFSRNKEALVQKYGKFTNIFFYENTDLKNFNKDIDIVLHCAFARCRQKEQLFNAYNVSKEVFSTAKKNNCKRLINISSQAVYNMVNSKFWTEEDEPVANNDYGTYKLATEEILAKELNPNQYLNIRLTALSGPNYPDHILTKLVNSALTNKEIKIVGGEQNFSFMHFYDALDAILLLFDLNYQPKFNIYNLGNNKQYNIIEMANTIKKYIKTDIIVEKKDIKLNVNMNSLRFMNEFKWQPKISLDDTIIDIINNFRSIINS